MLGSIAEYPGSIAFYILLVTTCCALAHIAQKRERFWPLGIAVAVLVVASALRAPHVGVDTAGYVNAYEIETPAYFEPGFKLLIDVLRPLHATWAYLGLIALIIYGLVAARIWQMRDYCSVCLAVAVFMLLYFPATWNGLRSYIVTAVMFYASGFIERRKYLRFLAAWVLCCTIHYSSVVFALMLLAAPFWKEGLGRNARTIMGFASVLLPFAALGLFGAMYYDGLFDRYGNVYSESVASDWIGLSWYLYFVVLAAAIYMICSSPREVGRQAALSRTIMLYVVVAVLLFLSGLFWFAGGRLSSYFFIYNVLLLPKAWEISKRYRYGLFFRFAVATYCLYALYQVMATNGQALLPYAIY